MTPALPPACRTGTLDPDTHLGRPGEGRRLAAPRAPGPIVTQTLLLLGAARAPERLRAHVAHSLGLDDVAARFSEEGAHLRVTLTGEALAVEGALEALPRLYLALRRR